MPITIHVSATAGRLSSGGSGCARWGSGRRLRCRRGWRVGLSRRRRVGLSRSGRVGWLQERAASLGKMLIMTSESSFYNQEGKLVATQRGTSLIY